MDINLTGFDGNLKQSLLVKGTLLEQFVQQKKFLKLYFCSQLAVKFVWCLYIIFVLYFAFVFVISLHRLFYYSRAYLTEYKKLATERGKEQDPEQ